MPDAMKILVSGITGQQGGAVAAALLDKGHRIRGLTRNPDSASAKALAGRGVELVSGDFSDAASLERAAAGVDAVFAVSTPFEGGMAAETAQGIAMADAAKSAGAFLLYNSVASADRNTGIPHFDSKFEVEEHIRGIGVPHTIVAPVYFMENALSPQTWAGLKGGTYATPLPADCALQQVALADIASFATLALEERDRFTNLRINIASDSSTGTEQAAMFKKAWGREVAYQQVAMDEIRKISDDFAMMYEWFISTGYDVDVEALRRDHPQVGWHRLEDWIGQLSVDHDQTNGLFVAK